VPEITQLEVGKTVSIADLGITPPPPPPRISVPTPVSPSNREENDSSDWSTEDEYSDSEFVL